MTEAMRVEWRESVGRVRRILDVSPPRPGESLAESQLLEAARECVRLLGEGERQLADVRNEQGALSAELANLRDRASALERSVLFRMLRALRLQRPLR